jgi:triosephosphate isomerase (TIM)
MPETIIAANWKMHKTIGEAIEFAHGLEEALAEKPVESTVVLAPPFTCLCALSSALVNTNILLAGQNLHEAESGAFTGEISAEIGRAHV